MKHEKKVRKQRKFHFNLRLYFALVSTTTLCAACLVSAFFVIVSMKMFYHGPITMMIAILLCLIVCGLTMFIGGIMLFMGAGHLTKPIEEINEAIQEVAKGDFKVRITYNDFKRSHYDFENELDELTQNVNKMTAQLDGMDYMQKDFMSNVSHEVKTPVAAITGFSEILMDENLEEKERQEYLALVHEESIRLSNLCENMLRMSRLDNQHIVVKKDKIRVDEQIRKCVIMLSEKWENREIRFELNLCPAWITSDADLFMQVWINIIDNAIKYSHDGAVIEIIETFQEDELIVKIKDQGIGISTEKIEKIFERFYQCEESHKKQGNGLGLSIVKRILELLGGTICYESEKDNGTTVTIQYSEK